MSKKAMGQDAGKSMQLLPGLPNHFVLNEIVPKLPWSAFHILSSVSPRWRDAIQSHQVYDSRVCSKSVEPLAVLCYHCYDNKLDTCRHAIFLYSTRDDSWHQLPEFPFSNKFFRHFFKCVALYGKLYGVFPCLPGVKHHAQPFSKPVGWKCGVYVLDLVGQNGWKKCADSPEVNRLNFACGVLNGKVYLFGGVNDQSFVYDPKEDTWSSIAPMIFNRFWGRHVVTVGDELWMHRGYLQPVEAADEVHFLSVYHPIKDKWDIVQRERCHNSESLFAAKGRPYLMTPLSIYGQEESSENKSWKRMHSFSFPGNAVDHLWVMETQAVDGELFTLFRWFDNKGACHALTRSKGFGTKEEDIELKVVKCTILDDDEWCPSSMCSIEL